ncbi:MAG: WecB/TagA/CpsF family glycosyltransferase [Gammaproteobacteria bacterium]|nr:WecB/TagA/CpsF family glycosyltransferase [Gammaproteobacteria bacterium]
MPTPPTPPTDATTDAQPQAEAGTRRGAPVLGSFIDALDWDSAVGRIRAWAGGRESRAVCLCNVHSAVTARDDHRLAGALAASDMVLPDGAPIAWTLRRKGFPGQTRIAGPDLMLRLCAALEGTGTGVFLFGASEHTLGRLEARLRRDFPNLDIRGALSPKFGDWPEDLERSYIETINRSDAGAVFVGLGCPRQEIWMARRKTDIHAVTLGVGAAFDFHAGTIERAPEWVQRLGLEWLHRLLSEPRRLWKRYLVTNTKFLVLSGQDLFTTNKH